MDEEELRRVHIAAQPATSEHDYEKVAREEDWAEETVFVFDDPIYNTELDGETPSLRADSGSPSPSSLISYHRSRSTSSSGPSLPPTPLLGVQVVPAPICAAELCDLFKAQASAKRFSPTSVEVVSANTPNPFFR
jgi:hypothetical protein